MDAVTVCAQIFLRKTNRYDRGPVKGVF
jgi:hypothetical protein